MAAEPGVGSHPSTIRQNSRFLQSVCPNVARENPPRRAVAAAEKQTQVVAETATRLLGTGTQYLIGFCGEPT
jgi:hypothetical protein